MTNNVPFRYSPIDRRPTLELPGGARLAVWFGISVEHFESGKPAVGLSPATSMLDPDPLNYGWRDYGPRVGIWRLARLLDSVGARASVFLNADACAAYPEILDAGLAREWVWLLHGKNNTTFHTGLSPDVEEASLREMIATLTAATGRAPLGWLGPALTETHHTPELLAQLGVRYVCDWTNDEQPYPLLTRAGPMIAMPYSSEINDLPMAWMGYSGEDIYTMITDTVDVMRAEGEQSARILGIGLHPFVMGVPWRYKHFARAVEHIAGLDDVWLTTSDDVANWYLDNYYLEPEDMIERST